MRSGMWILSVCGIAGLTFGVVSAQDKSPESSWASPRVTTSGRTVQHFPETKRDVASQSYLSDAGIARNPFLSKAKSGRTTERLPVRYVRDQSRNSNVSSTRVADAGGSKTTSRNQKQNGAPLPIPYGQAKMGRAKMDGAKMIVQPRAIHASHRHAASRIPTNKSTSTTGYRYGKRGETGRVSRLSSGLIRADYKRPSGESESRYIRQVGETRYGRQPTLAPQRLSVPPPPTFNQSSSPTLPLPLRSPAPSTNSLLNNIAGSTSERILPASPKLTFKGSPGPQTPSVTVHWEKKGDINVGQDCLCQLIVENTGKNVAKDVAVDAYFPSSVRLKSADPSPSASGDHLSWDFANLEPGEKRIISVVMVPSQRGEIATTAYVRFTGAASGVFKVEEPMLKLNLTGPNRVMLGDLASQIITVSNPGSGTANNVMIEAQIPAGLQHPRGQRLTMEVGTLNAGETRTIRLPMAAVTGGFQVVNIEATGDSVIRQVVALNIEVVAPSIRVAIDGPVFRYIGRKAVYRVIVANDGAAPSNNVRVQHWLPEGFDFVRADKGGKFNKANDATTWFVGRLNPGQTAQLTIVAKATGTGNFSQRVSAISEHGAQSKHEITTKVEGSASLVLEIVDLDDPVEVGAETAYEVRVKNEGTKEAYKVGIACELPAGVEFLSAKGPTVFRLENGMVVFKPIDQLPAGKTAIFRVHVQGRTEGNHRFRVQMASDSVRKPLVFEETTKFYGG